MTLSPELLVTIGLAGLGGVVWLIRLEGKVKAQEKLIDEQNKRLDSHSNRITLIASDGINANSLLKAIQNDVRLLVTNIRWILKVAKIDVPADIFSDESPQKK